MALTIRTGTVGTLAPYGADGVTAPTRTILDQAPSPWQGGGTVWRLTTLDGLHAWTFESDRVLLRVWTPDEVEPAVYASPIGAVVEHAPRLAGGTVCLDCGNAAADPSHGAALEASGADAAQSAPRADGLLQAPRQRSRRDAELSASPFPLGRL